MRPDDVGSLRVSRRHRTARRARRCGFHAALTAVRPHKGRLLIRAERVDDADAAKALAGAVLYAPRERLDVGPEEYLDSDLTGCRVLGVDGTDYGTVDGVEHYPASDVLVVGGTLVPMVAATCVRST